VQKVQAHGDDVHFFVNDIKGMNVIRW